MGNGSRVPQECQILQAFFYGRQTVPHPFLLLWRLLAYNCSRLLFKSRLTPVLSQNKWRYPKNLRSGQIPEIALSAALEKALLIFQPVEAPKGKVRQRGAASRRWTAPGLKGEHVAISAMQNIAQ